VAIFADKMLRGEIPTIFGNGEQLRDYVFVEDVARANLLAIQRLQEAPSLDSIDRRAYNIGGGKGTSVNELFAELKEITGFQGSPVYGPERPGELQRIFLDIRKAEKELSWKPSVNFVQGLRKTVEFFRERGSRRGG
jgi:UDP-glucose 4-epimerase